MFSSAKVFQALDQSLGQVASEERALQRLQVCAGLPGYSSLIGPQAPELLRRKAITYIDRHTRNSVIHLQRSIRAYELGKTDCVIVDTRHPSYHLMSHELKAVLCTYARKLKVTVPGLHGRGLYGLQPHLNASPANRSNQTALINQTRSGLEPQALRGLFEASIVRNYTVFAHAYYTIQNQLNDYREALFSASQSHLEAYPYSLTIQLNPLVEPEKDVVDWVRVQTINLMNRMQLDRFVNLYLRDDSLIVGIKG